MNYFGRGLVVKGYVYTSWNKHQWSSFLFVDQGPDAALPTASELRLMGNPTRKAPTAQLQHICS